MGIKPKQYSDLKAREQNLRKEMRESRLEKTLIFVWPYIKVAILFAVTGYFLDLGLSVFYGNTNAQVNNLGVVFMFISIWIHEIGHFTTVMFGNFFVNVFGGTLFQAGIPLALAVYLLVIRRFYAASFLLIWVGWVLFDVAQYMSSGESIVGKEMRGFIPNPSGIHDWRLIFNMLGVFTKSEYVSSIVYHSAFAVFIIGGIVGIYGSFIVKQDRPE